MMNMFDALAIYQYPSPSAVEQQVSVYSIFPLPLRVLYRTCKIFTALQKMNQNSRINPLLAIDKRPGNN